MLYGLSKSNTSTWSHPAYLDDKRLVLRLSTHIIAATNKIKDIGPLKGVKYLVFISASDKLQWKRQRPPEHVSCPQLF